MEGRFRLVLFYAQQCQPLLVELRFSLLLELFLPLPADCIVKFCLLNQRLLPLLLLNLSLLIRLLVVLPLRLFLKLFKFLLQLFLRSLLVLSRQPHVAQRALLLFVE